MADWDLPVDPLEALNDGDPAPFEAFVRSHARVFFAFFRRQGAGLHRAEDLTQDVFLKLYHHAPRYRAEERFQRLCLRMARNLWIDDRRRAASRGGGRHTDAAAPEDARPVGRDRPADEPDALVADREEADRLRAALAELPDTHRMVFELGVLQELGYAEIAGLLEIPVGTVKSRMYHAVRKLRRAVGDDEEEGAA